MALRSLTSLITCTSAAHAPARYVVASALQHKHLRCMSTVPAARPRKGGTKVFLPDFTVALVRPSKPMENTVMFRVDLRMNKVEIRDYLQAIYGVTATKVHTKIVLGKTQQSRVSRQYRKRPDYKLAYVELDEPFEFPETMFPRQTEEQELE
eukprot:m.7795 g.7795  ORF g.7795 m.7795 type:complete len:152 (-) comp5292_c0_seq1:124-579(-)